MERKLIAEYAHLHGADIYGFGGRHLAFMLPHVMAIGASSVIDYGAGRSPAVFRLAQKAKIRGRVERFDPAVPSIATMPEGRFDLLISTDVLEHIPEEEIDAVLAEAAALGRDALHVVDINPATALLSDGRNAHVSLHDRDWWLERLRRFYPTIRSIPHPTRAAFKTWEADLPPWKHFIVETQENIYRRLTRKRQKRRMRKVAQ